MIKLERVTIIATILILLLGIVTIIGFAWYVYDEEHETEIRDGYFEHSLDYYLVDEYDQDGYPVITDENKVDKNTTFVDPITSLTKNLYDKDKAVFVLNATNESAFNYVGKFVVRYNIKSDISMRFRMILLEEWVVTRKYTDGIVVVTSAPLEDLEGLGMLDRFKIYNKNEDYLTRVSDKRLYYKDLIQKDTQYNVFLIGGGSKYAGNQSSFFSETAEVWVKVAVQAVQANRFAEVWGVESDLFG